MIVLVSLALAIAGLGSLSGAASARGGPFLSSTIDGVDLKKGPVLTGSVIWTASAAGSQVSKVAFLIDDEQRWTESVAPYRFHGDPTGVLDTTTLRNGGHRLAVVAYSTSGPTAVAKARVKISNRLRSTPFTVTSNVADGSTVDGGLTWTASPRGASVDNVEFFVDGVSRWTDVVPPYRFKGDSTGTLDTTGMDDGVHALAVVARADDGRTATDRFSVTVANHVGRGKSQQTYPDAPSDLQVTDSSQQTSLTGVWTAVRGAIAYRVGRNGMALSDTSRTTYTWGGLACGTRYILSVQPERSSGDTGGRVATVSGMTASCNGAPPPPPPPSGQQTYPNAPIDLRVTDSSQQTTLTAAWTAVIGAAGYRIGRNGMALADSDRTANTWTGLTCGTTYTLSVQPERSTGDTGGRVATVSGTTASCNGPPPPPPPPPPPAPFGPITFTGDFETGDISPWQSTPWGGAQCLNYGVASNPDIARGNLYVVTDTVAGGTYSGRFDLPASPTRNACELLRGRTIAMDDEWYSMEIRLPSDWQEPSPAGWGLSLAQLNFQNIWGTPVSVIAHSNYVDLILNAGLCVDAKSGNPSCQYSSGIGGNLPSQHVIPTTAFSTGSWHQLLIHVKWTNGNDGVLEGFHRLRGETTWTRTAALSGFPTLQRTSTYTPVASDRTVDKIGAYRGRASFPLSIWQNNFCQATSMAAAEGCF